MFLIGDIGNTETKICLIDNNQNINKKIILRTKLISNRYLKNKLNTLKIKKNIIKNNIFSSVVPKYFKILNLYFKKNFKIKCNELKKNKLNKLINIKVNKKQIGSDRLANAIGAINNKNNFIILDFGTATTFDVVVKKNYLGGIIAPGVELSLENLIKKASLIPHMKLKPVRKIVSKNTKAAVRSGFYWGYEGLIKNIIKMITKETKKSFKVILTGGLSHIFKNSLNKKISIDRDLTMKGLFKIINNL